MDQIFDGYRFLDDRLVDDDHPLAPDGEAESGGEDVRTLPFAGGAARTRVRRAVRSVDGAPVAIKVFPAGEEDRARREADIAGAIDHPHLLRGSPVVARDGTAGLVFPWLAGGSLTDLIAVRRRLRWPEVLTVLIPIADALTAAHERGLVHGDVSPGNVLFSGDGRPMLADFGAARAATETGTEVLVTPQHVAPEIVRGAAPSPASDLFSLGSVALFCLTGRPAWPADDLQDVLIQSTAGQWPELEENMAPGPLREVVRRLLEPEPAERGSAARLAVELRRIGDPEPVALIAARPGAAVTAPGAATVVRPDAVRPPSTRLQQRHRAERRPRLPTLRAHLSWRGIAASVAVAALAVGAVGLGWWWSDGSPGELPAAAPGNTQWARVVADLDAARSEAFVARDTALLDAVYLPGSPARDADAARITALHDAGVFPDGARHRVTSVRVIGSQPDGTAIVAVVEDQPAAALHDASGRLIGRSPAVAASTVLLHVDSTDDGYRISRVERG